MKKLYTIFSVLCLFTKIYAQDFYDINTIQTIEIEFAQSNWDAILDAEKAGDNNYTEATSVTINGTTFYSVGVKYKGNSSYDANQTKNPFHIELDTYIDQDYQGYKDIKLANVMFDPSFVRETVSLIAEKLESDINLYVGMILPLALSIVLLFYSGNYLIGLILFVIFITNIFDLRRSIRYREPHFIFNSYYNIVNKANI